MLLRSTESVVTRSRSRSRPFRCPSGSQSQHKPRSIPAACLPAGRLPLCMDLADTTAAVYSVARRTNFLVFLSLVLLSASCPFILLMMMAFLLVLTPVAASSPF